MLCQENADALTMATVFSGQMLHGRALWQCRGTGNVKLHGLSSGVVSIIHCATTWVAFIQALARRLGVLRNGEL